jgi:endoglucanase
MKNFFYRLIPLYLILLVSTGCIIGQNPAPTPGTVPVTANEIEKIDKPAVIPSTTPKATSPADEFAFEQNQKLGKGVNLGNMLEAPNEGEWGLTVEEDYFDLIQEAGFDSVRIPIRWSAHALEEAPYTIDPVFMKRVDWVVEQASQRNLVAVINIHHYEEIIESPRLQKERFLAIWDQIANHFKDAPDSVYFELLNEPNGTLAATSWNDFANEAIKLVRKTNPRRTIIIGGGNWNSIDGLYGLSLPEDERNLIVTFHYYLPFQFTHQGAEWVADSDPWLGTTWEPSEEQVKLIRQDFDSAVKWAYQNRRPLFLGEFGAYSKADMDSRARWTEFVRITAEERKMSWAYWEFASGFGVYNLADAAWNEPLLSALIP